MIKNKTLLIAIAIALGTSALTYTRETQSWWPWTTRQDYQSTPSEFQKPPRSLADPVTAKGAPYDRPSYQKAQKTRKRKREFEEKNGRKRKRGVTSRGVGYGRGREGEGRKRRRSTVSTAQPRPTSTETYRWYWPFAGSQ